MTRLLDISLEATVLPARSKRATNNAPAKVVAQFEINVDDITDEEAGALARYVGQDIELTVVAVAPLFNKKTDPRPMDVALEQHEQNGHVHEERPRPGPTEQCGRCDKVIGEDPDAGFHTPDAGPPSPLCGPCYQQEQGDLAIAEERREEERDAFLAALDAEERTTDLRIALVDAYDAGADRQHAARALVGLEDDPGIRLPEDPEQYDEFVTWLREGFPAEEAGDAADAEAPIGEAAGEEPPAAVQDGEPFEDGLLGGDEERGEESQEPVRRGRSRRVIEATLAP